MPIIRIDYDGDIVSKDDAVAISEAAQKVVSEVTRITDVFVYGNFQRVE